MTEPKATVQTRRFAPVLVVFGGLGLLTWALWPKPTSPPAQESAALPSSAPRPSQTRRARALQTKDRPTPEGQVDRQAPLSLSILLGPHDRLHRNTYQSFGAYKAHQLLPNRDEAPWPEHPATDRLQELLDADAAGLERAERDALAQALIEAADDPALMESPWGQIITLEARKRQSLLTWCEQVPHPDCRWQWEKEGDVPPERDYLGLDADARALFEAYPDQALGDFAALYLLSATQDEDEGIETAFQVLESTPDPWVAAQAATLLMRHGRFGEPFERSEMDLVAEVWDGMDLPQRLPLALMGVDFALQRGDLSQAQVWQDRAEVALAANCEAGHHSCSHYPRELIMTQGQLAALTGREASSWPEVLTAAAWACYEVAPIPLDQVFEVQGEWQGGWTFSDWGEADPDFVTCFEEEADAAPTPPDGARVALRIET